MAETPPPFNPQGYQAPQKSSNPILWILVAIGAACFICVVSGVVMSIGAIRQAGDFAGCPMTMGMYNESLKEYVAEKGVLPPAASWQTELEPYYKKQYDDFQNEMKEAGPMSGMFKIIPPGEAPVCFDGSSGKTGIVFNADLGGKKPEDVTDLDNAVTFYESKSVALNANAPYSEQTGQSEQEIFGQKRDFYVWRYKTELDTSSGNSGMNIQVSP